MSARKKTPDVRTCLTSDLIEALVFNMHARVEGKGSANISQIVDEINLRIPPPRFLGGAWFHAYPVNTQGVRS